MGEGTDGLLPEKALGPSNRGAVTGVTRCLTSLQKLTRQRAGLVRAGTAVVGGSPSRQNLCKADVECLPKHKSTCLLKSSGDTRTPRNYFKVVRNQRGKCWS